MYSTNTSTTRYGGVALLVNNSVQYRPITLANVFDAISCEIQSKIKFEIASTYIAPDKNFTLNSLENI